MSDFVAMSWSGSSIVIIVSGVLIITVSPQTRYPDIGYANGEAGESVRSV